MRPPPRNESATQGGNLGGAEGTLEAGSFIHENTAPARIPQAVRSPIVQTMIRHWTAGLRDPGRPKSDGPTTFGLRDLGMDKETVSLDFHHAVRDEHPFADLATYNAAADEAWKVLAKGKRDLCIRLTDRSGLWCSLCDRGVSDYDEDWGIFDVASEGAVCHDCAVDHDPVIARLYFALVMLAAADGEQAVEVFFYGQASQ